MSHTVFWVNQPGVHTLGFSVSNECCVSPVCLFPLFEFFCFVFRLLYFYYFFFLFVFPLNLIWTPSVIRQWWIVGCRPPAAHPSPRPPGPQAGPRALCYHRGSCGLPAGWGSGSLWLLPSSSSFLLLLLSITSIGGGPSAFSANQLETGERCRLLCVHAPVCRVHSTTFFFFFLPPFTIFFKRRDTTLGVNVTTHILVLRTENNFLFKSSVYIVGERAVTLLSHGQLFSAHHSGHCVALTNNPLIFSLQTVHSLSIWTPVCLLRSLGFTSRLW